MTDATIQRVESSFQSLAMRGPELVDRFYGLLFARHPELRTMFPREMKEQKAKLLASLAFVVGNVRSPDVMRQPLLVLGARHVNYGTKKEHYAVVRDTLIEVMAEMAGPAWNAELTRDWNAALNHVAEVMQEGARQAVVPARTATGHAAR